MKLKVWNEKIRTFLSTVAAFVCLAIIFKLKSFNDFQSWKIARDGNFLKWFVYLKSTYRKKSTWIFVNFLVFFVKQCATFHSLKISIELMGLKIDFFFQKNFLHDAMKKKKKKKSIKASKSNFLLFHEIHFVRKIIWFLQATFFSKSCY